MNIDLCGGNILDFVDKYPIKISLLSETLDPTYLGFWFYVPTDSDNNSEVLEKLNTIVHDYLFRIYRCAVFYPEPNNVRPVSAAHLDGILDKNVNCVRKVPNQTFVTSMQTSDSTDILTLIRLGFLLEAIRKAVKDGLLQDYVGTHVFKERLREFVHEVNAVSFCGNWRINIPNDGEVVEILVPTLRYNAETINVGSSYYKCEFKLASRSKPSVSESALTITMPAVLRVLLRNVLGIDVYA
jgi:hypothetical protein